MRAAVLALLAAAVAAAHPAVHIVMDQTGVVFYSDNSQVWRIAADGVRTVAVPNVHTHELWLDAEDNLYGEHLEYEFGFWWHRVWKRGRLDRRVTDVIRPRRGFLSDYKDFSFRRDDRGAMYWSEEDRTGTCILRRGTPVGAPVTTLANLTGVRAVGWMTVLSGGNVIVPDHGAVIRIDPHGVISAPILVSEYRDQHSVMAAWPARSGSGEFYVADFDGAAVKKVAADGNVTTVAQSPAPWKPTGGMLAPDGLTMWILEADSANAQRARRVSLAPTRPPAATPR